MWWIVAWLGLGFIFACMAINKDDNGFTFLRIMFTWPWSIVTVIWFMFYAALFGDRGMK